MRSPFRLLLLVIFALILAACSSPGGLFFNPPVSVTPAAAPITVPGATPGALNLTPNVPSSALASPTATTRPTLTPNPERTPIRLKAPAVPATPPAPAIPTPAPTITATAVISPAAPITMTATMTIAAASESPTPIAASSTATATAALPPAVATARASTARRLDNTLNILVVGSDERREGQPWRSDVIMVTAIDFAAREVGVISFPRDLWVRIPTVGENRINTATFFGDVNKYPTGGIGLLKDTLARDFDLRIDNFVKFDFESFKDVIDALGGINMVVDCPITGYFPRESGSKELVYKELQPGEYFMDGFFALRYVRERKSTSDVDRARRQQRMLIAIRQRAREVNILPRVPALYDALKDSVETDLGLTDIIALARLGLQIDTKDAHGFLIDFQHTQSYTTSDGARVLLPDMKAINEGILNLFSGPSILENPFKPANCRKIE